MTITIHDSPNKAKSKMERHRSTELWPENPALQKPKWLRIKVSSDSNVGHVESLVKENALVTVCQEASCPNLIECFSHGTATFMIMGDKCTRRCSFCDVAHGRPDPLDPSEPQRLAEAVKAMNLKYVVVTSVDRDDLVDGGGAHFASCISSLRLSDPDLQIEILVPDFRKRQERALDALKDSLPDVFNHNLETVKRLYPAVRPGSDYEVSLNLIKVFKNRHPIIPTKSGIMLGLGETTEEVIQTLHDLKEHGCDGVTIGQYLQPSQHHYPVMRYVSPEEFKEIEMLAYDIGFKQVASGPFVRSSYHAEIFSKKNSR